MKETKPRRRAACGKSACAAIAATVALLAAVTAAAHVVQSASISFLSRDHVTVESQPTAFSTFEPTTLVILL